MSSEALEVVDFWREAGPDKWFAKDKAFDAEFKRRFYELHFIVARREREAWLDEASSALALLLLLDQFPRNAFRGSAHMFATDSLALMYANCMMEAGQIMQVEPQLRRFVALPFMHSERLEDQEYAMKLYADHEPDAMKWAIEHHDIIRRFGRFPHRNSVLGRKTTPEEQQYLDEGGFRG